MLGTVAADLALILGARGGTHIVGGIVPHFRDYFTSSPFRARFEQTDRCSDYLAPIPMLVIHALNRALIGAARAMERL